MGRIRENTSFFPLDEKDIIQTWEYVNKVYVSILLITYNQELYIRDAIESILRQRSSYKFEIIIHDDASQDATPDILKGYAIKYPSLIKLIQQSRNQYSKGKQIIPIAAQYAAGQYVAICEGDDYWLSPFKIEKQLIAMLANEQVDLSFHPALLVQDNKKRNLASHCDKIHIFTLQEVIIGDGSFMPTASLMVKKQLIDNLPDFFLTAPIGDYFLQVLGSIRGGALFIPEQMSIYRAFSIGSWSRTIKKVNYRIKFLQKYFISLEQLDNYLQKRFHHELEVVKSNAIWSLLSDNYSFKDKLPVFFKYKSLIGKKKMVFWWLFFSSYHSSFIINRIKNYIIKVIYLRENK